MTYSQPPPLVEHLCREILYSPAMAQSTWDIKVRTRAFQWLDELGLDLVSHRLMEGGFVFQDQRISLKGPRGIFKPKTCDYPISITTVLDGPYPDRFENEHRFAYHYRGTDPMHSDNVGLRQAMEDKVPLIYFYEVVEKRYLAIKPIYIVAEDPSRYMFTVMADAAPADGSLFGAPALTLPPSQVELRRRYATAIVQVRLHQASFRERVLDAYRTHCAMCRLKHRELLDAAHITADSDPEGHPEVSNGLSLCKIHHAAFDRGILGVRPDYVIEVRADVLEEEDGPMLKYGLQALNETELFLPTHVRDRPSKTALEKRYADFRRPHEG